MGADAGKPLNIYFSEWVSLLPSQSVETPNCTFIIQGCRKSLDRALNFVNLEVYKVPYGVFLIKIAESFFFLEAISTVP